MIHSSTHMTHRHVKPDPKPLYRGTQVVWYILWIVEALLAFRFFLKLIGANAAAGFTDFIYTLSAPLVAPFLFVVRSNSLQGNVFEWITLLAMLVYYVAAVAIVKLLVMGKPVDTFEAERKLEDQEDV